MTFKLKGWSGFLGWELWRTLNLGGADTQLHVSSGCEARGVVGGTMCDLCRPSPHLATHIPSISPA